MRVSLRKSGRLGQTSLKPGVRPAELKSPLLSFLGVPASSGTFLEQLKLFILLKSPAAAKPARVGFDGIILETELRQHCAANTACPRFSIFGAPVLTKTERPLFVLVLVVTIKRPFAALRMRQMVTQSIVYVSQMSALKRLRSSIPPVRGVRYPRFLTPHSDGECAEAVTIHESEKRQSPVSLRWVSWMKRDIPFGALILHAISTMHRESNGCSACRADSRNRPECSLAGRP